MHLANNQYKKDGKMKLKFKPKNIQNQKLSPTWSQLLREIKCSVFGHQFCVPKGGAMAGLPQSHCYRCGKKGFCADKNASEWEIPTGSM